MNALQNIATKIGFFNCTTNQISAKSANNNTVDFVFEDSLNEMAEDGVKELLLTVFNTIGELETNHLTQDVVLKYYGYDLKLEVTLVGDGNIEHEGDFDIDDASEINEALDELILAHDSMNEMKDSVDNSIDDILGNLHEMPLKGLTSRDCQKTCIQNIINSLSYAINGTSVIDFLDNWEEL